MYSFLDYFFVLFHTALILFILVGWVWPRTRNLHLAAIALTMLSWFGLGMFYGWGYCAFTDWHWQIKRKLGETDLPYSYIKYYLDKATGIEWDPFVVETTTFFVAMTVFLLSCLLNWRDWQPRSLSNPN